jgi:prepilin-type N-terminal cleavage/methylation domain-containing protein
VNPTLKHAPSRRRGFSLIEVTLAIGIVGIAILSLVGILGSTFQQVDDIMQTNRALSGVTRLVSALDNPRGVIWLNSATSATTTYLHQGNSALDPTPTAPASNFDIAYRLLAGARDTTAANAVWLYVYERKLVTAIADAQPTAGGLTYNLNSNPAIMEVVSTAGSANADEFTIEMANARNVVGTPMRVRLSLSKLLIGQRVEIDPANGEPTATKWAVGTSLPADPNRYALAYLPVVAEFFPHDFSTPAAFKAREETPLLVQNIVISR